MSTSSSAHAHSAPSKDKPLPLVVEDSAPGGAPALAAQRALSHCAAYPHNGASHVARIAISGGPGAGKSTTADLLRREFGTDVAYVPEAATLLFSGGFPREASRESVRATQRAIFHTQRSLEDVVAKMYPGRVLLCDRGSLDGAAYWPGSQAEFFATFGTSLAAELDRYDGVLFFHSAACRARPINSSMLEGGNAHRLEGADEARSLNDRLRALWAEHPHFDEVESTESFLAKVDAGARKAKKMLRAIQKKHNLESTYTE